MTENTYIPVVVNPSLSVSVSVHTSQTAASHEKAGAGPASWKLALTPEASLSI
jgi:hypothetical protein